MANRFKQLFQLSANQYSEDSPVLVVAGVLLKDSETNNIVAQLKFKNVCKQRIKALKISLAAYDVSGVEIQGVSDYQYLELDVHSGRTFGTNKAIVMPVSVTRSFAISSIVVVLKDGTVWESSSPFSPLSASKPLLFDNSELEKQYCISTNDSAKYFPCEDKGLWQCACGVWNSDVTCTDCYASKSKIFAALDVPTLTEQMNIRLEKERIQREEEAIKHAQLKEQAAVRRAILKKRIKIIAIIAAIITILIGSATAVYIKMHELTIEKMLALYTKEDVIALLGEPENDSGFTQYDVSFMDEAYSLAIYYSDNKIDNWSLAYYYPGIRQVESIFDIPDYYITPKDKEAAKTVLSELLESFKEKYGEPETYSHKNTTSYTWIVNDRMIELTDCTRDRDLSLVSAIRIRVNCDHQSFCSHTDTNTEHLDATCTQNGYNRKTCSICGYVNESTIKALGHNETSEVTQEATCSAVGEKKYRCQTCGYEHVETINMIAHKYQETILKEATCTANGFKKRICSVCGDCSKEEHIKALGHNYIKSTERQADCETSGIYIYTCTRCNDSYRENTSPLGHSITNASCETASQCSRCQKHMGGALGHIWNKNWIGLDIVCDRCNASYKPNIKFVGKNLPQTCSFYSDAIVTVNDVSVGSETKARMDYEGNIYIRAHLVFHATGSGLDAFFSVSIYNSRGEKVAYERSVSIYARGGSMYVDLPDDDTYYVEVDCGDAKCKQSG